jgi:hypothetical protein
VARLLWLAALSACVDTLEVGECNVDGDCAAASPICLYDVEQARSYCSAPCTVDRDCPSDSRCQLGGDSPLSGSETFGLCVRRVRQCAGPEVCDGLDNDCNGVIDDPGCGLISGCNDDAVCGSFVCMAPPDQPDTLCAPPRGGAYGNDCTSDDQCPNGECSAGFCAPLCRAQGDLALECDGAAVCARGMGARSRPPHNLCQIPCDTPGDCRPPDAPEATECVWRDIHRDVVLPGVIDHVAVCALLDPERLPLGSRCEANTPAEDDRCQYGLCLFQTCTRICGGPGSDCSGVSPGFVCEEFTLRYGEVEYPRFVCVRPT